MEVRPLDQTPLEEIVECLSLSFADYFVKMPKDPAYWKARWKGARVDYRFSYGMFDQDQLVGFMVHGADFKNGIFTAFNTGTGVIPEYRGRGIVRQMYKLALQEFKDRGIQQCTLEVIQNNESAIRAYQKVGFEITRKLKCYQGKLPARQENVVQLKKGQLQFFDWDQYAGQVYYSWDHMRTAILLLEKQYELYKVFQDRQPRGYFIINPQTGYLAQFDIDNRKCPGHWSILFEGIGQICPQVKIINVDKREKAKTLLLDYLGLDNYIDQYEMELHF